MTASTLHEHARQIHDREASRRAWLIGVRIAPPTDGAAGKPLETSWADCLTIRLSEEVKFSGIEDREAFRETVGFTEDLIPWVYWRMPSRSFDRLGMAAR
jgi:hypothetical protein